MENNNKIIRSLLLYRTIKKVIINLKKNVFYDVRLSCILLTSTFNCNRPQREVGAVVILHNFKKLRTEASDKKFKRIATMSYYFGNVLFSAFLLFLLLGESASWTTTITTPTSSSLLSQRTQHQLGPQRRRINVGVLRSTAITTISDHKDGDDDDNMRDGGNSIEKSIMGRRGWLGSIATVAGTAATFARLAPPANASDQLPTGKSSVSTTKTAATTVITSKAVCDPTVSVWNKNGRVIYLLGTAHISSSSAALAGQLVRDTTPKGVFIELDAKRVSGSGILAQKFNNNDNNNSSNEQSNEGGSQVIVPKISAVNGDGGLVLPSTLSLATSSSSSSTDITTEKALKPTPTNNNNNNPIMKAATAVVGKSIKGLYQRLDSAGFDSGEEFVTAVKEGRKLGSSIILGDRDVEVTLRRVTEGLAKTDLKALLSSDSELEQTLEGLSPMNDSVAAKLSGSSSSTSDGTGKELTDEEFRKELSSFVETMKTKDNVRKIMGQLQRVAPFLYEALVSERDVYMATGLNGLNELESIVAVVGIAHADGIETSLQLNGWQQKNLSCSKYS